MFFSRVESPRSSGKRCMSLFMSLYMSLFLSHCLSDRSGRNDFEWTIGEAHFNLFPSLKFYAQSASHFRV